MTTQQPENRALAIVPRTGIVLPAVDTDGAVAAWNAYVNLCKAVIGPEDVQKTWDGEFRKKSAFRKLARFYDLTDRVILSDVKRDERGRPIFAAFTVRATAPNGREAEGYHECHLSERCCAEAFGDPCDKKGKHKHCAANCSGWSHWSHPGDIPATAHTRAKNRAISDLIGAGEVSAEEVGDIGPDRDEAAPASAPAVRHDVDRSLGWCSKHQCGKVEGKYGPYCPNRDEKTGKFCKGDPDGPVKPAEAPAPRPEAKTPPVETTARPAETLDFPPDPKAAAPATGATPHNRDAVFATPYDLMQAAQRELGLDGRAVAIVLGAAKPKLTPTDKGAWATLWDHWVASRAPAPKGGAS